MGMGVSRGGWWPFDRKEEWLEHHVKELKKTIKAKDKEIARIKKHELKALGLFDFMNMVKQFHTDIAVIIEKQIERKRHV